MAPIGVFEGARPPWPPTSSAYAFNFFEKAASLNSAVAADWTSFK